MYPDGDRTLDELLAAAAPVTDHGLDRPEVRAAARALIEELPMAAHPTAPPGSSATAADRPPHDVGPGRGVDAGTPDDMVLGLPTRGRDTGTADDTVVLPAPADRPHRRGRRAVAAAAAALALAVGSAAVVGGGGGAGDPVGSGDPVDSSDPAAGSPAASAQPADLPDTACGWSTLWLDVEARGDQDAVDRLVARMALAAIQVQVMGDETRALEAEALMRPMSAGDRAGVEAWQTESCTG